MWKEYMDFFTEHALTHDDGNGVIVFGHTKATVEELFYNFVEELKKKTEVLPGIRPADTLHETDYPERVFNTAYTLEAFQTQTAWGHEHRVAYNHAEVGDNYSDLVGSEVTNIDEGIYRVIFCTSTYAAGVNLRKFDQVFIDGNQERVGNG
jgi:replicative superfamily II helicase